MLDFEGNRLEWLAITAPTSWPIDAKSATPSLIVFDAAGSGDEANVALTFAARLPDNPVTSFDGS
jgi:hypothetical protein